jgi:hypothetical protein
MNIRILITILTEKIPHRTDSIFYAGKNIATVKIFDREYVLTTAGEYRFTYTDRSGKTRKGDENSPILKQWKDHKIRYIDRNGGMDNWGWFGINLWVHIPKTQSPASKPVLMNTPTDVYSTYDEALKAFREFIEKDINEKSL